LKVFLLWQDKREEARDPVRVGRALAERFAPLFEVQPPLRSRSHPGAELVWLDVPLEGWKPATEQEDADRWALAIDPPINARAALRRAGVPSTEESRLLDLARSMEKDPRPVLRELAPNASIIWHVNGSGATHLQTDGLGQAQLFEYEDESIHVLTNRIHALDAIGVSLEPIPEEWAARYTLGWFPLHSTGYRNIRTLRGGTRLTFSSRGVERSVHGVLHEWVHPPEMSREDALDLGATALHDMCREASDQWVRPTVGLSGGFDSRAIVSILRHLDADVSLRVRGHPERLDVLIANHLATSADLALRIKPHGGMPPMDAEGVRRSIRHALLWQGGGIHLKKHLTFRVNGGFSSGCVNVMGSHAGIGKADYAVDIGADRLPEAEWENALLAHFESARPISMREDLHESVREACLASIREADRYDLHGLHRLHFLFLHEYTRRWAAGAINGAIDLVITPFLSPDFIRAAYAFPPEELPTKPFHRHVIARYAPDWAEVPYDSELTREDKTLFAPVQLTRSKRKFVREGTERWRPGEGAHRVFHRKFYWRDVGKPVINAANTPDSFTTEIFDHTTMRRLYKKCPDAIAITHLLPSVGDDAKSTASD